YLYRYTSNNYFALKIFATGHLHRLLELKEKIGPGNTIYCVEWMDQQTVLPENLEMYDLLFDLNSDDDPSRMKTYTTLQKPVIVCAVKKSLHQLVQTVDKSINCHFVGMNALPTFINRSKVEISFLNNADAITFDKMAKKLDWEYLTVQDTVGMVTPRVIAMVINEACFTLYEETASMHDIDIAMKLGTNYPFGPFEWCDRIGVKDIYETLDAIAEDTGDLRYKICPLLKEKYLLQQPFYTP
ncbi:MAG: 3-hydroxyacyl-CoA dehydrogenase family protein, partial [Chitinophagales bacterium]